jgi:type IV secretion system protein VirD4
MRDDDVIEGCPTREASMDWFRSEFEKWGVPIGGTHLRHYPGLERLDEKTRALFEKRLPRGVLYPRLQRDRERINYWMSPGELMGYRYELGQLMIGKLGETFLGHLDDRPMVTLAGSRAGKTSTVLEPNLYLYSGSMLVLDPKGELARAAKFRRAMGHDVYILDPFGQSGETSASFNPLAELDADDPVVVDDVMAITYALVPDGGSGSAKHFNDSARTLLLGFILLTLTLPKHERHLVTVRELLCLTYEPLAQAARIAAARALADASEEDKKQYFDANSHTLRVLLNKMAMLGDRFGGIAAAVGSRMLQTPQIERGGVFTTAAVHTDFIDSLLLRETLRRSDFKLAALRGGRPVTIFLCLPVGRMERHFRWLRLIVQLACTVLEGLGTYPRGRPPILFMLEEFATLGHMDFMERAAAYFPSFGVKPWFILQDVTQLKAHYKAWESFLGNAGVVQLFANGDGETNDYAARRLGKLIAPWELETAFAREHLSQVLLMKGQAPAAAMRLAHGDVELIRERARAALDGRRLPGR